MKSLVTCCLLSVALALGSVASAYGQGKIAFTRRGEIYVASIGHAGKLGSERNVTNDPSIDS